MKKETANHYDKVENNGHQDDDHSSTVTVSSPEPEEYTYERAIQGYVNFAETRVKSRTALVKSNINKTIEETEETNIEKLSNGHGKRLPPSPPHAPRRQSAAKIEEKLSALEKRRRSSTELNNSVNKDLKMPIAKGELLKRRAMFELASELSEFSSKPIRKLSSDTTNSKETQSDKTNITDSKESVRLLSGKTSPSKEKPTDTSREKVTTDSRQRLSNGDLSSAHCIQERLLNREKQNLTTEQKNQISDCCITESIKERLSNLDSASNKDNDRKVTPERDPSFQAKLASFQNTEEPEKVLNGIDNKDMKVSEAESERSSSPEDVIYETKRQQFHRSLDSLDVEGSSDVGNEAFERVQSLEDLDCCSHRRNYPASTSSTEMLVFSSQSGDTDREDSGIHTADVSCSVSQADEPVEDGEIIATINSVVPHLETSSNGADVYHLEVEIVNQKHQQAPFPTDMLTVPKETAYVDVPNTSNNCEDLDILQSSSRNNTVSVKMNSHPLKMVVEENEELPSFQTPETSDYIDTDILSPHHSSSLVMAHIPDNTQTPNELSIGSTELEGSHVLVDLSTPTKVAVPSQSSFDSENLNFSQNNNTAPNNPQKIQSTREICEAKVVETDISTTIPVNFTETHPECLPIESCLIRKGSAGLDMTSDERKTLVDECEKIIMPADECLGSPLPNPFITKTVLLKVSRISNKVQYHSFNKI